MALFILTWMGPSGLLAERELFPVLYEEALDVLAETCPELPLFLKPHPAMNDSERCWAIERARERVRLKVMPTDLHPMVLARRARFAIGLCYSTTFSMLRFMEVPTVEYTNYADHILAETDGGSMRPEFVTYYVNRDRKALARILRELSANSSRRVPSGTALLGDGPLLHALAGQS